MSWETIRSVAAEVAKGAYEKAFNDFVLSQRHKIDMVIK